jgi:ABC-type protease/lipase transport system fused ATPase/permease subunit
MVAHQPYVLRNADKLLFLSEGRMRAFGSRDEVLSLASGATTPATRPRPLASAPTAQGALPQQVATSEGA